MSATRQAKRVNSWTLDAQDEVAERDESCASLFTSRWKTDKMQIVLVAIAACLSGVIAGASHSRGLVQVEHVSAATGDVWCKNYGWLYRTDCDRSESKEKLLSLDMDLGASGIAFGVAHLIQSFTFLIVAVSVACYNPERPIRRFRSACSLVLFTILVLISSTDVFLAVHIVSSCRGSEFHKFTPLWRLHITAANVIVTALSTMVAMYVGCSSRHSERVEFEKISSSLEKPPSLSEAELEEFYGSVGHRGSVSLSPPTHRRRSSAFSAILGIQTVVSPHKETTYALEDSVSSGTCSPLSVELDECMISTESPRDENECPITTWSVKDVSDWVRMALDSTQMAQILEDANVNGHQLWHMTDEDLESLGLGDLSQRRLLQDALCDIDEHFESGIVDESQILLSSSGSETPDTNVKIIDEVH